MSTQSIPADAAIPKDLMACLERYKPVETKQNLKFVYIVCDECVTFQLHTVSKAEKCSYCQRSS